MDETIAMLRARGIQPTQQRVAVLRHILKVMEHLSADEVLAQVRRECPMISRATVYNTLNLLVRKDLLRTQILKEGTVVFDRNVSPHHHFIDEASGRIYDIPWSALKVSGEKSLEGYEIREYQVVMRGRRRGQK